MAGRRHALRCLAILSAAVFLWLGWESPISYPLFPRSAPAGSGDAETEALLDAYRAKAPRTIIVRVDPDALARRLSVEPELDMARALKDQIRASLAVARPDLYRAGLASAAGYARPSGTPRAEAELYLSLPVSWNGNPSLGFQRACIVHGPGTIDASVEDRTAGAPPGYLALADRLPVETWRRILLAHELEHCVAAELELPLVRETTRLLTSLFGDPVAAQLAAETFADLGAAVRLWRDTGRTKEIRRLSMLRALAVAVALARGADVDLSHFTAPALDRLADALETSSLSARLAGMDPLEVRELVAGLGDEAMALYAEPIDTLERRLSLGEGGIRIDETPRVLADRGAPEFVVTTVERAVRAYLAEAGRGSRTDGAGHRSEDDEATLPFGPSHFEDITDASGSG